MRSTKLYFATMALGLVFALAGSLAAQDGKASFDGAIGMYNACNPISASNFAANACSTILNAGPACYRSIVSAPGFTEVDYHNNGGHATVHVLFHNDGQDYPLPLDSNPSLGSYRLNLEATQKVDNLASPYYVPFHSVWASLNGATSFMMDGTVKVDVQNGTPIHSEIVLWDASRPLTLSCANQ